jgi:hypothetical protein
MKKLNLLFALIIIAGALVAQQVDRDKVILESATGTW